MAKMTRIELEAENTRLRTRESVLEIALTDSPDATYTHRCTDGDRYKWSAYRLDGPHGGVVTCVFTHPNQRPMVVVACLLDALREASYTLSNGAVYAYEQFSRKRYDMTQAA